MFVLAAASASGLVGYLYNAAWEVVHRAYGLVEVAEVFGLAKTVVVGVATHTVVTKVRKRKSKGARKRSRRLKASGLKP